MISSATNIETSSRLETRPSMPDDREQQQRVVLAALDPVRPQVAGRRAAPSGSPTARISAWRKSDRPSADERARQHGAARRLHGRAASTAASAPTSPASDSAADGARLPFGVKAWASSDHEPGERHDQGRDDRAEVEDFAHRRLLATPARPRRGGRGGGAATPRSRRRPEPAATRARTCRTSASALRLDAPREARARHAHEERERHERQQHRRLARARGRAGPGSSGS